MRRSALLLPAACAVVSLGIAPSCRSPSPTPVAETTSDAGPVAPFVQQWCGSCHTGDDADGGLDLSAYAPAADVAVDRALRERIALREMPPADAPQPGDAARDAVLHALGDVIAASDRAAPVDPGHVPLRRLSRTEYANTVRELLGVAEDVGRLLPPDELGLGFDNLGGVATLSPLAVEKYVDVAERLAAAALPDEEPDSWPVRRLEALRMTASGDSGRADGEWWHFYAGGTLETTVSVQRDGRYRLRARTFGDQAGPEPARIGFRVGGRSVGELDVPEVRRAPGVRELDLDLPGGSLRVGVAFVNDYYRPEEPDPSQRDRNLAVEWVEVVGPLDRRPPTPLATALDATDPGGAPSPSRAAATLAPFVARAFRRPELELRADGTVDRLATLVDDAVRGGATWRGGLRLAVTSVLASPRFLFRVETSPTKGAPPRALDAHELSVRLAYFLWSAPPDAELIAAASAGELATPSGLRRTVRRMLRDARATALPVHFAGQWLEVRNLAQVAPDPTLFPQFDEALRSSMRRETELFVEAVVREGRPLRELLDADFTYVDGRLARHYGLSVAEDAPFARVRLGPGRRGGVLTQASVLTVTSNPDRTSPVKRGKWVLDNLLDDPPPPPPPAVGNLDESPEAVRGRTLRERLVAHRSERSCATCHERMDALGFALEGFDPVGRPRDRDGEHAVDDVGTLPDGRAVRGAAGLRALLADDPRFVRALVRKLFVYGVGRGLRDADAPVVDAAVAGLPGADATFEDVIVAVVESAPFRLQAAPAAETVGGTR